MPIVISDSDNISIIHTAERLQINLAAAEENIENMVIEVFFNIETRLPTGKTIGLPYWDSQPLLITCKNDVELKNAMTTIQKAIGYYRYKQLTQSQETLDTTIPPSLSEV